MVELTSPDSSLEGLATARGHAFPEEPRRRALAERVVRWLVPALPALVALLVVRYGLDRRQLWLDEIATWMAARKSGGGLADLADETDVVIAPYYLLMSGWIRVFGDSEASLRAPSLLAVALAAALTAAVGRKLFDSATGLFAGLLVAVLPTISRYGQEARPYALAAAATVLATLLLLRAAEGSSWLRWLAYAGAVALTGLLHLVALLILLAHFVYVVNLRGNLTATRRWLAAAVIGVLPVLPLAWFGSGQAQQVSWIPAATWDSTINEVARVTGSTPVGAILIGLALLACWPPERSAALIGTWAVAPFFVLLLASPWVALLVHRYVLFTVPAWCLLAVVTVMRHGDAAADPARLTWRRHLLPSLLVVLCAAFALPAHGTIREIVAPGQPDLRGAVAVITADARAGDVVGVYGRYPSRLRDGVDYYFQQTGRRGLPIVFTAWPDRVPSYPGHCRDDATCLTSKKRLWLISASTASDQRDGMHPSLAEPLRDNFELVRVVEFADVTLSLWQSTA